MLTFQCNFHVKNKQYYQRKMFTAHTHIYTGLKIIIVGVLTNPSVVRDGNGAKLVRGGVTGKGSACSETRGGDPQLQYSSYGLYPSVQGSPSPHSLPLMANVWS